MFDVPVFVLKGGLLGIETKYDIFMCNIHTIFHNLKYGCDLHYLLSIRDNQTSDKMYVIYACHIHFL